MDNQLPSTSSSLSTSIDHRRFLDNLPDFNYSHLFKHLDLDEIWSIRLVSKSFYSIVKSYDIIQLSFAHNITDPFICYESDYKCNRFSTSESIKLRNHLALSKLSLLQPTKPSNNLLNLKYLSISNGRHGHVTVDLYWNFKILNKFTKLKTLDLHGLKTDWELDLLELADLESLSLQLKEAKNLIINAPKLINLHIDVGTLKMMNNLIEPSDLYLMNDKIYFKSWQSVKHLRVDQFDSNVLIFKNLECLEFEFVPNLRRSDLVELTNLKKLKFNHFTFEKSIDILKDLAGFKEDLEMFICGVRLRTFNQLCNYWFALKYQLDNYDDLEDDLEFVTYLYYTELMRLLRNYQLPDLLRKYTNVQFIYIDGRVEDANRLINFIKESPNLYQLDIRNSSLSQEFYDQLPAISSLSKLRVLQAGINFKFVKKLIHLVELFVSANIIDEGFNPNDLLFLKKFSFKFMSRPVLMIKKHRNMYFLSSVDRWYNKDYYSLEEIRHYFKSDRVDL